MLNFVAFCFLIVFIVNVCCIYMLKERKKIIKLKKKKFQYHYLLNDQKSFCHQS